MSTKGEEPDPSNAKSNAKISLPLFLLTKIIILDEI